MLMGRDSVRYLMETPLMIWTALLPGLTRGARSVLTRPLPWLIAALSAALAIQSVRITLLKKTIAQKDLALQKSAMEHEKFVNAARINQERADEIISAADKNWSAARARIKEYEREPIPTTPEAVRDWTLRVLRNENP